MRGLRHDTDMLRRAGREIGGNALPASIAAPRCQAAESAARTLRALQDGVRGALTTFRNPRVEIITRENLA